MEVNCYCLTGQGLQRNTLLHTVALPWAFSHSPLLTDHQHPQTVTQTKTSPTERHLQRHTPRICTAKVHRHLALNHPCRPLPAQHPPNNFCPSGYALVAHVHHEPGQKQSNHTFPVSGSRGCVCLSGVSRE